MKRKVIVLTGGGTAGHVLPCLALLPYLKSVFSEIHFIGSNSGYEKKLVGNAAEYHGIDAVKLARGNLFKAIPVPFKLWKAKRQAAALLKEISPDAIFSKGGYVALPVVLASKGIPVYLHESDLTMGLANRLSLKKCTKIFTSFDTYDLDKAVCTGSPIRRSIYDGNAEAARRECGFVSNKPVLLVMGGSSGAKAVNECIYSCLDRLLKTFDIVHITGEKFPSEIKRVGYRPIGYADRIEDYLALCDYAVSRGGSGALFELMALKIPTLIIPLPKGASRGDQVDNAEYFSSRGAALVLPQNEMDAETLPLAIERLMSGKAALKDGMDKLGKADGTREIAKTIIAECAERQGEKI
ncbi:MAG: UDP-N-acetylglucosamine--N-acetylmuramyl-(pentapeptide) pyrophosphoryl-undecaprenol N-acetylglucosamine transferase [Clostridia bacterium]|nr:UDP-N-acetylglucosamine--N-acetylmuramyl-(pentapeptide) pyrophosphoryl-undecaprenol N-acetylglucosamine transferase [Clostridia bacterium]